MISIQAVSHLASEIVKNPGLGHSKFISNPWEAEARYPRFLKVVMQEFGLKVAVECGVDLAISTEYMISSHPDSLVIGLDWALRPDRVTEVYNRHPKNVIFESIDTTKAGNRVKELLNGKTIDLLFLDSTHDGVTPTKEFMQFHSELSAVSLICCDDILAVEMTGFWDDLPGEKVQLDDLHLSYGKSVGFGVSIYRK